ncbi:hypothetical protein B0H11DRAFT_1932065 [Mycena galericulata]|nr:hypothetical protein B0H11DRAFT_1932065 [Mycena galericulata]
MTGWCQASYQLDIGRRSKWVHCGPSFPGDQPPNQPKLHGTFYTSYSASISGSSVAGRAAWMALSAAAAGVIDLALEVVNDAGGDPRRTYLPPEYAAKCYNNELHLSLNETAATDKTVDDALLTMYLRELEAKLITRKVGLRSLRKESLGSWGYRRLRKSLEGDLEGATAELRDLAHSNLVGLVEGVAGSSWQFTSTTGGAKGTGRANVRQWGREDGGKKRKMRRGVNQPSINHAIDGSEFECLDICGWFWLASASLSLSANCLLRGLYGVVLNANSVHRI